METTTTVREASVVYRAIQGDIEPPLQVKADSAYAVQKMVREAGMFPEGDMRERFICLMLDARNYVVAWSLVSVGTLSTSLVHPREVFRTAVGMAAAAIILLHNHPSGDSSASVQDDAVTARMSKAGQILGIPVLDHLIMGELSHYSYREVASPLLDGELA
jgi:DNA repair protein RadC